MDIFSTWEKFSFPVIKSVAENLIAPDIVAVQPLAKAQGSFSFELI